MMHVPPDICRLAPPAPDASDRLNRMGLGLRLAMVREIALAILVSKSANSDAAPPRWASAAVARHARLEH